MAVTGIGGIFFRAADPERLSEWYRTHLNVGAGCTTADVASARAEPDPWFWRTGGGPVVFAPFPADSNYFAADRQWMLNLRVDAIDRMIAALRNAGIAV